MLKACWNRTENNLSAIIKRIGADPGAAARNVDAAIERMPKVSGATMPDGHAQPGAYEASSTTP